MVRFYAGEQLCMLVSTDDPALWPALRAALEPAYGAVVINDLAPPRHTGADPAAARGEPASLAPDGVNLNDPTPIAY